MSYRYFRKQRRGRSQMGSYYGPAVHGGGDGELGGFAFAVLATTTDQNVYIDPDGDDELEVNSGNTRRTIYGAFDDAAAPGGALTARGHYKPVVATANAFGASPVLRDADGDFYVSLDTIVKVASVEVRDDLGNLLQTITINAPGTTESDIFRLSPDARTFKKLWQPAITGGNSGTTASRAGFSTQNFRRDRENGKFAWAISSNYGSVNNAPAQTVTVDGESVTSPAQTVNATLSCWNYAFILDSADDSVLAGPTNVNELPSTINNFVADGPSGLNSNRLVLSGFFRPGATLTGVDCGATPGTTVTTFQANDPSAETPWLAMFDLATLNCLWSINADANLDGTATQPIRALDMDADNNVYVTMNTYNGNNAWSLDRKTSALSSAISMTPNQHKIFSVDEDGDVRWETYVDIPNGGTDLLTRDLCSLNSNSVVFSHEMTANVTATGLTFGPGDPSETSFTQAEARIKAGYVHSYDKSTGDLNWVRRFIGEDNVGGEVGITRMNDHFSCRPSGNPVIGFQMFMAVTDLVDLGNGFSWTRGAGDQPYQFFVVELDASNGDTLGFKRVAESDALMTLCLDAGV